MTRELPRGRPGTPASRRRAGTQATACLVVTTFAAAGASATPTARFDDPAPSSTERVLPHPTPEPGASLGAPPRLEPPPPTSPGASLRFLLDRARRHRSEGNAARALHDAHAAVNLDPGSGEAWLWLALLWSERGELRVAEDACQRAVALPESRVHALHARALLRRARGAHRLAEADLREAVEAAAHPEPWVRLLSAWYVERGAWPAALGLWRRRLASLDASDEARVTEAVLQVRALARLAAETDAAQLGLGGGPFSARRTLARHAARPWR